MFILAADRFPVALLLLLTASAPVYAVRPFITDDARVVGGRQAQAESWLRGDRSSLEQWVLASYGPTAPLELTVGAVHGGLFDHGAQYSIAGPVLQAKYLLRPWSKNSWPGIAVTAGVVAPSGIGDLQAPGWEPFGYVAVTESILEEDQILIHANGGFVRPSIGGAKATWGLGTQVRVRGGFHFVGETFSGDPYSPSAGVAYQVGFRHFFSEYVQIDATVGGGLSGTPKMPVWATVGIRLVSHPLERGLFRKN